MATATGTNGSVSPDDVKSDRLFYLAPEFRRAAMWGIAGCVLIAIVGTLLDVLVIHRGSGGRAMIVATQAGAALWLSQYLFPRIRVDRTGISRRFLWWWDIWTWEAFAEGRIQLGFMRHSYVCPNRPWHVRRLTLCYLDDNDAEQIDALIRRYWTRPPDTALPDVVEFRLNWPDRREVRLTENGLTVSRSDGHTEHQWDDIRRVEIWRIDAERRDFRELLIELPNAEFRLRARAHEGQECRNWRGARSTEIAACVSRSFQRSDFRDYALFGTARSLDELDARLLRDEAESKESLSVMKWCARACWVFTVATIIIFPWPNCLAMTAMTGLMAWAAQWMHADAVKEIDVRRRKYETERAAFATAEIGDACIGIAPTG